MPTFVAGVAGQRNLPPVETRQQQRDNEKLVPDESAAGQGLIIKLGKFGQLIRSPKGTGSLWDYAFGQTVDGISIVHRHINTQKEKEQEI